jgi:hypothetical protein
MPEPAGIAADAASVARVLRGLIHTSTGSTAAWGRPAVNRSGFAAYAAASTVGRAAGTHLRLSEAPGARWPRGH